MRLKRSRTSTTFQLSIDLHLIAIATSNKNIFKTLTKIFMDYQMDKKIIFNSCDLTLAMKWSQTWGKVSKETNLFTNEEQRMSFLITKMIGHLVHNTRIWWSLWKIIVSNSFLHQRITNLLLGLIFPITMMKESLKVENPSIISIILAASISTTTSIITYHSMSKKNKCYKAWSKGHKTIIKYSLLSNKI